MSDFPFPEGKVSLQTRVPWPETSDNRVDYPVHISATQWSEYYKMYARHFSLYDNIVLNAAVELIERDHENERWTVHIAGEAVPRSFDKVVLASGSESKPVLPAIDNLAQFRGRFMHSQAYKG